MRKSIFAFAAGFTCACATAASAQQTWGPPVNPGGFLTGGHSISGSGTFTEDFNYPGLAGTETVVIQEAPAPFISVSISGCCTDYYVSNASARADFGWYAMLTGPDLGPVPMELFENLSSSQSGVDANGWAEATAGDDTAGGLGSPFWTSQEVLFSNGPDDVTGGSSTPGTLHFYTRPGDVMGLDLSVFGLVINGSAYSSADPYLMIDPSFAAVDPNYATDYTLAFSPGFINSLGAPTSGVPEPSTWAMMLLGFGGIGFGARGNRKTKDRPELT